MDCPGDSSCLNYLWHPACFVLGSCKCNNGHSTYETFPAYCIFLDTYCVPWALLGLKNQRHMRCDIASLVNDSHRDTSKQMCVSKLPGQKTIRVTRCGVDPSKCQVMGGICQTDKQGNLISAMFDCSGVQILQSVCSKQGQRQVRRQPLQQKEGAKRDRQECVGETGWYQT